MVVAGLTVASLGAVAVPQPAGAAGGGCHRDQESGPVEGTGSAVELVELCMTPTVLRVEPGAAVTFTNRDPAMHNLFGSGIYVGELHAERSVAFRFDDAGVYPYACTIHPGMVGAIVVGDGRRLAPTTRAILPIQVQPVVATTAAEAEAEALPVVPAAIALATVATVGYVAGGRRRRVTPTA